MKKLFSVLFSILFLLNLTSAQERAMGLEMDDDSYMKYEKLSDFFGSMLAESPVKLSLKDYSPIPGSQGSISSCVGHSVGYGCMSMEYAIKANNKTKADITRDAFSALYIYNQIISGSNCLQGSKFDDAFRLLKNSGNVKYSEFDKVYGITNCSAKPDYKLNDKAKDSKIEESVRIFDIYDSMDKKVSAVKLAISQKHPVMIGMLLKDNFDYLNASNYIYNPGDGLYVGGHAMVVVGYNDITKRFEILNSWGENWGNKGYFEMSYSDFAKDCKYGFYMNVKPRIPQNITPVTIVKNLMQGEFNIKSISTNNNKVDFTDESAVWKNGYYELLKKNWPLGSQFQLHTYNVTAGQYVYVFSIDPEKRSYVHFPKNENLSSEYYGLVNSPIIPSNAASIIIPDENSALTKDKAGTDYLFILYCNKPLNLSDLKTKINTLAATDSDPVNNFYRIFANDIIPSSYITYGNTTMSVKTEYGNKTIAPLILKIGS